MGQRVNHYMADVQIKRLKKLSKKTGLSVSEHIRRAVDEYLYKQEMEKK